MDSTTNNDNIYFDKSYKQNEDDEITYLVNASIYKQWRSEYVDEIELSVWNIDMVKFAISTTFDNYGPIRTAIQRGVPDIIKHYIWIKANDADRFYMDNPSFYANSFASTFGDNIPTVMGDYCPTFSGGIFGLQSDLVDYPIVVDQLHTQFDRSLESKVFHDKDHEYNYWINPYKESSPNIRANSSISVASKKSSKGIGKAYSLFIRKFRMKPPTSRRTDSSSFSDNEEEVTKNPSSLSLKPSQGSEINRSDEMESSSSLYSIEVSDMDKGSKSGLGNKDRLIDYIHLLNNENANKRQLMKSALARIRKRSGEKRSFVRNIEKTRQMSDTFIYNTKYSYFPPPPSHHSKLMQSSIDINTSRTPDNPFYNVISQKKKKTRRFLCIPLICGNRSRSKSTNGGMKQKNGTKTNNENDSKYSVYYGDESNEGYNDSYRDSESNLYSYSAEDNSDQNSEDGYHTRHYSDSQYGYSTYVPSAINHLPIINTIPEHSASNSVAVSYSRSCSNTSNAEEGYVPFAGTSPVKDGVNVVNAKVLDKTDVPSISPSDATSCTSKDKHKQNDNNEVFDTQNLSKIYSKDMELIQNLSREFTRNLTNTSLDRSVYKLDDVTDFTVLLTEEGVLEVKRILWVVNSYFSTKIEFLPVIPSMCCLLLIYLSPHAALCVLYRFMSKCTNNCNLDIGMRFFFVDRRGFVTFVTFVISVIASQLKKTVEHLKNLRVDLAAWVARSMQTGFSQILPFDYIVRIYGNLLFEGEMVLCRYCVALIKCISGKLLSSTSKEEAEEILYHIGLDDTIQIDKLTKLAFSLRIKKFDKKIHEVDTPTPYLMNVKIRRFYRPRLSSSSSIVCETHWEFIWAKLKAIYRILDPQNLYSSNKHGSSMTGLVKRVTESVHNASPALLFIKTSKLHVFGVFIPNLLNTPIKGYFTPQEMIHQMNSFIFTLSPYQRMFEFTSKNSVGIKLSADSIIVGANEPAIIVDKTLSTGHTAKSDSYDSPALVSESYFSVYMVEVWTLS